MMTSLSQAIQEQTLPIVTIYPVSTHFYTYYQFWPIFTHFDPFKNVLTHFDLLWPVSIRFQPL